MKVSEIAHSDPPKGTRQVLSKPKTAKTPGLVKTLRISSSKSPSPSIVRGHGTVTCPRTSQGTRSKLAFDSSRVVPQKPADSSPGAPQLPATERSPVLCPARLPRRTASSSPPAAAQAVLLPPRPRPRPPAPAWPAAPREASKGEGGGLTGTRPRNAPPTAPALSGCTRTQLRTTWDELMES